jgi:hypothetical protein
MMVVLYRHSHGVVVHDGDHFPQVSGKQPVKQHLIAIVQGGQKDIPTQRIPATGQTVCMRS